MEIMNTARMGVVTGGKGEGEGIPIKDHFRSPFISGWDHNKIVRRRKFWFDFYNDLNFILK